MKTVAALTLLTSVLLAVQPSFAQKQCGGVFFETASTADLSEQIKDVYHKMISTTSELAREAMQKRFYDLLEEAEKQNLNIENLLNETRDQKIEANKQKNELERTLLERETKRIYKPIELSGNYEDAYAYFSGSRAFLLRKDARVDIFDTEKMQVIKTWDQKFTHDQWRGLGFWGKGQFATLTVKKTMSVEIFVYDVDSGSQIYNKNFEEAHGNYTYNHQDSPYLQYRISVDGKDSHILYNPYTNKEHHFTTGVVEIYHNIDNGIDSVSTGKALHGAIAAISYESAVKLYNEQLQLSKTIDIGASDTSSSAVHGYLHNIKNHQIYILTNKNKLLILDDQTFNTIKEVQLHPKSSHHFSIKMREDLNSLIISGLDDLIMLNLQTFQTKALHRPSEINYSLVLNENLVVTRDFRKTLYLVDFNTDLEMKTRADDFLHFNRIGDSHFAVGFESGKANAKVLNLETLEIHDEVVSIRVGAYLQASADNNILFNLSESGKWSVTRLDP